MIRWKGTQCRRPDDVPCMLPDPGRLERLDPLALSRMVAGGLEGENGFPRRSGGRRSRLNKPWKILYAKNAEELKAQDDDPLLALASGRVAALVLRGFMDASRARDVTQRLLRLHANEWKRAKGKKKRNTTFATIGPTFTGAISREGDKTSWVDSMCTEADKWSKWFRFRGFGEPIHALHTAVEQLARSSGRQFSIGRDVLNTNRSFGGGVFRRNFPGHSFALHFDSIRHSQRFYTERKCGEGADVTKPDARRYAPRHFPDLYRFDNQLSALLMLQRSETPASDLSLIDAHWGELLHDCEMGIKPTAHNVHIRTRAAKKNGLSSWGVSHKPAQEGELSFDYKKRRWRTVQVDVQPGDIYLFNSNRLHVVHAATGSKSRMSLGSFLGMDARELKLWS